MQNSVSPPANQVGDLALTLGVIGFLVGFVPVVGDLVAAPTGVLAMALGWVGVGRVEKGLATNMGRAAAGVILGIATVLVTVVTVVAMTGPVH